ncbi:unnamed protein product [Candida verbasci]|uniref:SPS-sensor serine protease component SSY5 n=1 Tax=Candida verbasci TaxID=1227364 RepID=A0A9W4X887_9ASCO|nr:unnamed protein product [Candida verbasci]
MKRFLTRSSRRSDDKENIDDNTNSSGVMMPTKSNQSDNSHDSIRDLRPIFNKNEKTPQYFDMNLNPSISITNSKPMTITSSYKDSLFSSRQSYSTNQSLPNTANSKRQQNYEYGQPLQILNIVEEDISDSGDIVNEKLGQLFQDLSYITSQFNNSLTNLSASVIDSIDCLKSFTNYVNTLNFDTNITTYNNSSLRKIFKIYLNYYDNLLKDDVYIKLKLLLVKHFDEFIKTINKDVIIDPDVILKPINYAIGSNKDHLPNEDKLMNIIDKMITTTQPFKEQNGSFIAPITRGLSPDLNILCLYFGYPNPSEYHYKQAQTLHDLYDDVHILVMKNKIELAATSKFKFPFRVPLDVNSPPISISISTDNSNKISGTLGGYIYPKINLQKQPKLKSYANSKFAISCGHVCLDTSNPSNYPHISAPSTSLISMYKNALVQQYKNTNQNDIESKQAYYKAIEEIGDLFPMKRSKTNKTETELRNLPQVRFGQIIWGERTLINLNLKNEISGLQEKKLSDLAIIKVNKSINCHNFLGDDVPWMEYDPSLIYENLYIRKVLNLKRYIPKHIDENINEIDSNVSEMDEINSYYGVPVFKYGSTTKYTRGYLNGIKLVYWLDGAIHSSEFIVNSLESNSCFASGGDSGSWILTKLQELNNAKGLGVIGMLHSYDGEYKQFGLFTPMNEILNRLKEVTNIEWGVLGCEEEKSKDINDDMIDESILD